MGFALLHDSAVAHHVAENNRCEPPLSVGGRVRQVLRFRSCSLYSTGCPSSHLKRLRRSVTVRVFWRRKHGRCYSGYEALVKRNAFSCYTVADNVFGNDDDLRHNLEDRTVLLVDDGIFLLDGERNASPTTLWSLRIRASRFFPSDRSASGVVDIMRQSIKAENSLSEDETRCNKRKIDGNPPSVI